MIGTLSRFDQKSVITSSSWRLLRMRRLTVQRLRSYMTSHAPWTSLSCRSKICSGVLVNEGNQPSTALPTGSGTLPGLSCCSNQARPPPAALMLAVRSGLMPPLKRRAKCRSTGVRVARRRAVRDTRDSVSCTPGQWGVVGAVALSTGQGKSIVDDMVTSGEAGIDGLDPDECKRVREQEEIDSARI